MTLWVIIIGLVLFDFYCFIKLYDYRKWNHWLPSGSIWSYFLDEDFKERKKK